MNGTPLPPRQEGVSFFSNNVTKGQFQPIYFAFDSFEIASDEGNKLRQIGSFLKTGHNNIILAGFTDERGTPEYNRGLGERRAQAARNFLLSARSFAQSHPDSQFWPGNARRSWT